jgi:hypothetical protein
MADVEWLDRAESPSGDKFVLVTLDRSRESGMPDLVIENFGATVYVVPPYGEAECADAIGKAKEHANKNGFDRVYVDYSVRKPNAPGP